MVGPPALIRIGNLSMGGVDDGFPTMVNDMNSVDTTVSCGLASLYDRTVTVNVPSAVKSEQELYNSPTFPQYAHGFETSTRLF